MGGLGDLLDVNRQTMWSTGTKGASKGLEDIFCPANSWDIVIIDLPDSYPD